MNTKLIAKNPTAYHNYTIEDKIEAGIVLYGTEIKSIRNNKVNLKSLVKSAFFETTRVKSVIGAIAEEFDFENDLLNKLKNSLNPLSMVYLKVGNAVMYTNNWQIRADRK